MRIVGFVAAICLSLPSAWALGAAPIHACAANLEYPPYLFSLDAGGSDRHGLGGLANDILQYALKNAALAPARIDLLPWPRCLKMTEIGSIDVILNVPTAQIDPAPYYISEPYAQVHSVYYVSRRHWPNGIAIKSVQDLTKYRLCGLIGNRYEGYGIATSRVDTGANNYVSLINKLHVGHCDLFIEKLEVIDGLQARNHELHRTFSAPTLLRMPLPEDSPFGLHYAISRQLAGGRLLLDQLNGAIAELQKSGQLEKWLDIYLHRSPPAKAASTARPKRTKR